MAVVYVRDRDTANAAYRAVKESKHVYYDLETTGLNPRKDAVLLAQFLTEGGDCFVFNCRTFDPKPLVALMADPKRVTVAHNASFEYQFTLCRWGYRLGRVYCSMVAEAVLTAGGTDSTGLADTVKRRLDEELDKGLQTSFVGADPATFEPTAEQVTYAASDVLVLPRLRVAQVERLKLQKLVAVAVLEFDALPAFAEMELAGMRLDLVAHREVLAVYKQDAEHYGEQAAGVLDPFWQPVAQRRYDAARTRYDALQATINHTLEPYGGRVQKDTPQDIRDKLKELRKERDKSKPREPAPIRLSSRDEVLAALAESGVSLPDLKAETVEAHAHKSPVLAAYAKYVKAQKIVSTYGDGMAAMVDDGRLRGRYNQVVSTGRTSSAQPNMQNMPKKIRACFVPEAGHKYVVADFANMEMRIFAGLSADPTMIDAFATGKDLHQMTAAAAWPDLYPSWRDVPKDSKHRASAKTANFACIYGGSAEALFYRGLIDDLETAKAVVDGIAKAYPVGWTWIHEQGYRALEVGYAETATGRKRYFPDLGPKPRGYQSGRLWEKAKARVVRQAMNMPVQGTGADIAKRSMTLIHRALICPDYVCCDPGGTQHRAAIVGMVHDEIIVECPTPLVDRVRDLVADSMQRAGSEIVKGVAIPADVHIAERWEK